MYLNGEFYRKRMKVRRGKRPTSVADPNVLGLLDPDPDPVVRGTDPDPDPLVVHTA
jgi:hypothetical protein